MPRAIPTEVPNMKERPRLVALLSLALILALAAIACSEPNARIAFISDRDGDEELYVMNADGSDVTRLTHTGGHIICCPRWSPDGQRIAFTSNQNGNHDIYLVNADGSGLTQLTHSDRDDSKPDWSPDGQRIAFTSGRYGGGFEVSWTGDPEKYLADIETYLTQLTGDSDIYLVNPDGSDLGQADPRPWILFHPQLVARRPARRVYLRPRRGLRHIHSERRRLRFDSSNP